jgi:hypothetical protein
MNPWFGCVLGRQGRKKLLHHHHWPTAMETFPRRLLRHRWSEMITQRHDGAPTAILNDNTGQANDRLGYAAS